MSADVRLDPATLRWCADKLRADLLASLEFAANNTVTLGAYEDAEEVVGLATAAIEAIESAAAEAESRPLLSDWVRACEGTALGEPDWSGECWDDTGFLVARYRPILVVSMAMNGDSVPESAVLVHDSVARIVATTPAELRAALDRLAAEVPS